MGWYVHIHVCFSASENEPIAALASRHLPAIEAMEMDHGVRYAIWFLQDVAKRTGTNPGPKGGLVLWGMVGNYTLVDKFCEYLKPFWFELLSKGISCCQHDHIMVFEEQEQSEAANAYEIFLADERDPIAGLVIRKHERLPFTWMQF